MDFTSNWADESNIQAKPSSLAGLGRRFNEGPWPEVKDPFEDNLGEKKATGVRGRGNYGGIEDGW